MALIATRAEAFSLLGPYADWMDEAKGYRQPFDIGGPMNIGEGYRWNIPVITYGFERSFLDYFGSNGVAAVEAAIQILNQVPPASQLDLQDYPPDAWRMNYFAEANGFVDLKSTVLKMLLEQLGLASPTRFTFCIRDYQDLGASNYYFFVIQRNFDPVTTQPSAYVNDARNTYFVFQYAPSPTAGNLFCDAIEVLVDPLTLSQTAAADFPSLLGLYATNLSRDDVGGLRYLLSGAQVRYESLPPDVHSANTNAGLIVSAYRPGIEKITFTRHPTGLLTGEFLPCTNRWTDVYYSGDDPAYQQVERVTARPDIVFSAQDLGANLLCARSGTSNWVNNADFNGNSGGAGPGVIQPGVVITLNNVGPVYVNSSAFPDLQTRISVRAWASFGATPTQVIRYPSGEIIFPPTSVRFRLALPNRTNDFQWLLSGAANGLFLFQTSTGMTAWTTLATITNSGTDFNFEFNAITNEASRFFRIVRVP